MEDQRMSGYDLSRPAQAAADEPGKSHASPPHPLHSDHRAQEHPSGRKKKKKRDPGTKILDKLANALARSNLRDDDISHDQSKKLTKGQRKRQNRERREAEARKNGEIVIRQTRSASGMLPLGFDRQYLDRMGDATTFMSNDQIRTWIKSIFTPHIESWYNKCLSAPENQLRLRGAQDEPLIFANTVIQEAMDQHLSPGRPESLLQEADECPTAFHLERKESHSLTFIQHSAMVACLVVRDGQPGGAFAVNRDNHELHSAAAMLLTSVIMDLRTDLGYFLRLLLGIDERRAAAIREGSTFLSILGTPRRKERADMEEVSRVIPIPSDLFGNVSGAFSRLQRSSDCRISIQRPEGLENEYEIVLVGPSDQAHEMELAVQKLVGSSTALLEMEMMNLSIRGEDA
jgi:hypothetical protein